MKDKSSAGGRALVLTDPTLFVRRANERLVMLRDKQEIAAIPVRELSHVALHGPVTMTGAAVACVLDAGVDITLYSSGGRYRGTIYSAQSKNVYLLLAQTDAWSKETRRLDFARLAIVSKLEGQRQLLQRHALDHGAQLCRAAAEQLQKLQDQARKEDSIDGLLGQEGAAAAAYFGAFGEMLSEGWSFPGRIRRPPTDPVNSLLSFGYTLAVGEMGRHLLMGGFDTRIGLLHGLRYGRESLSLDLIEEFRAPMVDRFTLRLVNNRSLLKEDFEEQDDGSVRLKHEPRRKYLELWEQMLNTPLSLLQRESPDNSEAPVMYVGPSEEQEEAIEGRSTWRSRMIRQVGRLRRFLLYREPYQPMLGIPVRKKPTEKP